MALTVTDLLNAIMGGGQTSITTTPPIVITPPSSGSTVTLSGSSSGGATATITPPLSYPQPSDALAAMNLAAAAFSGGHSQFTSGGQTTYTPPVTNTSTGGSTEGSSGGSLYFGSGGMSTVTVAPLSGMTQTVTNILTAGSGSVTINSNAGNLGSILVSAAGGSSGSTVIVQANMNPVNISTLGGSFVTLSGVSASGKGSSAGGVLLIGSGSTSITNNSLSGGVTVTAGTLTLGTIPNISSSGAGGSMVMNGALPLSLSQSLTSASLKVVTLSALMPNGLTASMPINLVNGATVSGAVIAAAANALTLSNATLPISNATTSNLQSGSPAVVQLNPTTNTLTTPAASTPPPVVDVTGSTLVNNGVMQGVVNVGDGGVLKGNGTFDTVNAGAGGTVSPGNSPGTMTDDNTTWGASGKYEWQINDLSADQASGHTGTAGGGVGHDGWDLWNVGTLTFVPGFVIEAHSITVGDADAAIANFNAAQHYQWEIATSNGNFSSDVVSALNSNLNATAIASSNGVAPGLFDLFASGDMNGLYLEYTPVPEPGTMLLAGCAAAGLAWRARRRRAPEESRPTSG